MLDRPVYNELLAVSLDRCRVERDNIDTDELLKVGLALSRSLERRQDAVAMLPPMSNNEELRLYQSRMNDLVGSGLDQRSVSIGR